MRRACAYCCSRFSIMYYNSFSCLYNTSSSDSIYRIYVFNKSGTQAQRDNVPPWVLCINCTKLLEFFLNKYFSFQLEYVTPPLFSRLMSCQQSRAPADCSANTKNIRTVTSFLPYLQFRTGLNLYGNSSDSSPAVFCVSIISTIQVNYYFYITKCITNMFFLDLEVPTRLEKLPIRRKHRCQCTTILKERVETFMHDFV